VEVWVVFHDEGQVRFKQGRQQLPGGDWYVSKVFDDRQKATVFCKERYKVENWREITAGGDIKMLVEIVTPDRIPQVKIERWTVE
jgi:hypothetical protein